MSEEMEETLKEGQDNRVSLTEAQRKVPDKDQWANPQQSKMKGGETAARRAVDRRQGAGDTWDTSSQEGGKSSSQGSVGNMEFLGSARQKRSSTTRS